MECQGVGSSKGIKGRRIKKTKCDWDFHQEALLMYEWSEVRVWGKNLELQGAEGSKGIKGRRVEKTKCDRAFLKEVFLV